MAPPSATTESSLKDTGSYGSKVVNGIIKEEKKEDATSSLTEQEDLVLKTFRLLVADLCEQFKGGHPGGAIGMAAIGMALWRNVMQYSPKNPDFINRDRFVLSNGHTCLFQYCFLHLTGFKAMTMDQLKSYHSDRVDALCPGHPEIEHEGVEVTTGPLGQGVANAVGLAMATKHLASEFNKPGYDVVSNRTWCMVGDACLQEGVALEAISLAGHFRLNNLCIIYDNNQITCDGLVSLTNTEDVNAKMRACQFNVIDIEDGCFDIHGITKALESAKNSELPTFINVRTVIGVGSAVAGDAVAHGAAFAPDDVVQMKKAYGFNPEERFVISETVRDYFKDIAEKGEALESDWNKMFEKYRSEFPELADEFKRRMKGELPENWESIIPSEMPEKKTASRAASGLVLNPLADKVKQFMVGTADLSPSVHMAWKGMVAFEPPHLNTGSYNGRYIHYGIREHAMAGIANGLAAYHEGMILPVTSSFFMFYLYAAPAVRMGALQRLHVIHAATHDSIGGGEDGPTHQPIELAALYRAMPNILYIRPGDSEETAGAWIAAIKAKGTPSIISTSRHGLPQLKGLTKRHEVAKGAYLLKDSEGEADVTLIGSGSELNFAVSVADKLTSDHSLKVRVISFPSQRLFERQPLEYRRKLLQRHSAVPTVVIEAYAANGWERYADAAICMGADRFGQSLPGPKAYEFFGFEVNNMTKRILGYLKDLQVDPMLKHDFVEMTQAHINE